MSCARARQLLPESFAYSNRSELKLTFQPLSADTLLASVHLLKPANYQSATLNCLIISHGRASALAHGTVPSSAASILGEAWQTNSGKTRPASANFSETRLEGKKTLRGEKTWKTAAWACVLNNGSPVASLYTNMPPWHEHAGAKLRGPARLCLCIRFGPLGCWLWPQVPLRSAYNVSCRTAFSFNSNTNQTRHSCIR